MMDRRRLQFSTTPEEKLDRFAKVFTEQSRSAKFENSFPSMLYSKLRVLSFCFFEFMMYVKRYHCRPNEEKVELDRQNQARRNRQFLRCPEQVDLPGIDIECVELCVTHQESPSQFWAIRSTRKESLQKMDEDINACLARDRRPRNLTRNEAVVGALVIAPFRTSDDEPATYYRARIDASRQDKREHLVRRLRGPHQSNNCGFLLVFVS